jgi:hypothetical protein
METITGSGYPLGFAMDQTEPAPIFTGGTGETTVVTEARMMTGHQKEAIVHEGIGGPRWRLTSDEGKHLNGADEAPFPLGFFNAGLHTELHTRLRAIAAARGKLLDIADLSIRNFYWMTGSFAKGTGEGFSDPAEVILNGDSAFLQEAINASPAFDALRRPLQNTFALYVNGTREDTPGMTPSEASDAPDPYLTYREPPVPMSNAHPDLIRKTGVIEDGKSSPAPVGTDTRIIRTVAGKSRIIDGAGTVETDTWLEMPGVTHFSLQGGGSLKNRRAPSGLALLSAGVAFCYLTQLSRYIEHLKLDINGVRLVQYSPFAADGSGHAGPVDTHLFLNGRADTETHGKLLRVAARTCYLHATLAAELPPVLQPTQ